MLFSLTLIFIEQKNQVILFNTLESQYNSIDSGWNLEHIKYEKYN